MVSPKIICVNCPIGPTGEISVSPAARAQALASGRAYVLPDDVKVLARPVLLHRLLLSTESELDGVSLADVLTRLLDEVPVLP